MMSNSGSPHCLRILITWPDGERQVEYLKGHWMNWTHGDSPTSAFSIGSIDCRLRIQRGYVTDSMYGALNKQWHNIMIKGYAFGAGADLSHYPREFGYHVREVWRTQAKGAAFALMCALRKLTVIDKNVVTVVGRMVVDSESDSDWSR